MNMIRVLNRLDPDQDRHFVSPDMGPNCLQRSSADYTSRQSCHVVIVVYLLFYIFNESAIFCFLVPHVKMQ